MRFLDAKLTLPGTAELVMLLVFLCGAAAVSLFVGYVLSHVTGEAEVRPAFVVFFSMAFGAFVTAFGISAIQSPKAFAAILIPVAFAIAGAGSIL